jgi:stage II sporulation protein M
MVANIMNIKTYRKEIALVTALFCVSLLAGILTYDTPLEIVSLAIEELGKVGAQLFERGPLALFLFIFLNNIIAVFTALVGGIIFGITPILSAALNGYLIGVVVGQIIPLEGITPVLAALLPHGIIEIPLLLVTLGLSLRVGITALKAIKKKDSKLLISEVKKVARFAWFKIMPFVVLAAFIEAFITPGIVRLVM